jgi:hypothetical protein
MSKIDQLILKKEFFHKVKMELATPFLFLIEIILLKFLEAC